MQRFHDEGKFMRFTMRKPADMHQHFRDGEVLRLVAPMVAKRFAAAIIMPNLVPPITTADMAAEYRRRVRNAIGESSFKPLMTLYLTDSLDPNEVRFGIEERTVYGLKYYPRGLTTNSDSGVADPSALWTKGTKPYQCLEVLAEHGTVLLIHAADGFAAERWKNGDHAYRPGDELDPYDQELHFMDVTLSKILDAHAGLKVSVEHLSTAQGADQVRTLAKQGYAIGCSLTPHHLLLTRKDVFRGGFRPHRTWMPVIQSDEHCQELRILAREGHTFVWLGSDSAPHPRSKKEADCCASGVLTAHAAIELYVEIFEDLRCLDERFEEFASVNGPKFFGVAPSEETIELVREDWRPQPLFFAQDGELMGRGEIVPFRSYKDDPPIRWRLVS